MDQIETIYKNLLIESKDIYVNEEFNFQYVQLLREKTNTLKTFNSKLNKIIKLNEKFIIDCNRKSEEIDKELKFKQENKSDIKLYNRYAGLSWADIDDIETDKENNLREINNFIDNSSYKIINSIDTFKPDFPYKLPKINNLNDLPNSIYYYEGDNINISGIYTKINNTIIRIPFPDSIDYNSDKNKKNTILCKNITSSSCKKFRIDYNSDNLNYVYNCNFLHKGDRFKKINNFTRTPNNSRFGKHLFLNEDLSYMPYREIQPILLYSLSDLVLVDLWLQNQESKDKPVYNILNNIDILT